MCLHSVRLGLLSCGLACRFTQGLDRYDPVCRAWAVMLCFGMACCRESVFGSACRSRKPWRCASGPVQLRGALMWSGGSRKDRFGAPRIGVLRRSRRVTS